jgi:hypothetical protein
MERGNTVDDRHGILQKISADRKRKSLLVKRREHAPPHIMAPAYCSAVDSRRASYLL